MADHVWDIESVVGSKTRVIRVDLPTRRQRFGDVLLGVATGCTFTGIAVAIVQNL